MAKKTAARGTTPTRRKADKAPAPVYRDIATLTIKDYNGLAENQKQELREWLGRRMSEITNEGTALAKSYVSHYKIPKAPKAAQS